MPASPICASSVSYLWQNLFGNGIFGSSSGTANQSGSDTWSAGYTLDQTVENGVWVKESGSSSGSDSGYKHEDYNGTGSYDRTWGESGCIAGTSSEGGSRDDTYSYSYTGTIVGGEWVYSGDGTDTNTNSDWFTFSGDGENSSSVEYSGTDPYGGTYSDVRSNDQTMTESGNNTFCTTKITTYAMGAEGDWRTTQVEDIQSGSNGSSYEFTYEDSHTTESSGPLGPTTDWQEGSSLDSTSDSMEQNVSWTFETSVTTYPGEEPMTVTETSLGGSGSGTARHATEAEIWTRTTDENEVVVYERLSSLTTVKDQTFTYNASSGGTASVTDSRVAAVHEFIDGLPPFLSDSSDSSTQTQAITSPGFLQSAPGGPGLSYGTADRTGEAGLTANPATFAGRAIGGAWALDEEGGDGGVEGGDPSDSGDPWFTGTLGTDFVLCGAIRTIAGKTAIELKLANGQTIQASDGTAAGLSDALLQAMRSGQQVVELNITGHGGENNMSLGSIGDLLTTTGSGNQTRVVTASGVDLTNALRNALAPNATVNLQGCNTAHGSNSLAEQVSRALPGCTVTGSRRFALRMWRNAILQIRRVFINGEEQ